MHLRIFLLKALGKAFDSEDGASIGMKEYHTFVDASLSLDFANVRAESLVG